MFSHEHMSHSSNEEPLTAASGDQTGGRTNSIFGVETSGQGVLERVRINFEIVSKRVCAKRINYTISMSSRESTQFEH